VGTEDETNEIDFRRSRRGGSWGRRAPTSLLIAVTAVTAVVASPWTEAPYRAKPSRKNQNTDSQVASACGLAALASEISATLNCSEGTSRLSRGATREVCSGLL
jgi:hypothetical protein